MIKAALVGVLLTTGMAFAAPASAQAGDVRFGIQFSQGYYGPSVQIHYKRDRYRNFKRRPHRVTPRQIRRTVRSYGCYDISPVRRVNQRYKVKATCGWERVKMTFSARSGRLIKERIVGYQPRIRRDYRWRH